MVFARKYGLILAAGCLSVLVVFQGWTQSGFGGRETQPISRAGQEDVRPPVIGSSGLPGRAGGMGTTDENAAKDAVAAYDNLFKEVGQGYRLPYTAADSEGSLAVRPGLQPTFRTGILQWQYRPDTADIKIGNFYLDFRALSGALLFTDNKWLTATNRQSGVISKISLEVLGVYQIEDRFRVAYGIQIAYLPFANKIGFGDAYLPFAFGFNPHALAQVSYKIPVHNWEIEVYDTFTVATLGTRLGALPDIFSTDVEFDRAGRYLYHTPYDYNWADSDRLMERYFYRNRAGVTASTLLPTVTRFRAGFYRMDTWASESRNNLSQTSENMFVALINERENMRFKPFADYTWQHLHRPSRWTQTGYGGFTGPITDQLDFLGEMGYYHQNGTDRKRYLWSLHLAHTAGPFTRQEFDFRRSQTYPSRGLMTSLGYQLNQVIAQDLTGSLYLGRSEYEDLDDSRINNTQYRIGASLTYDINPRWSDQVTVTWARVLRKSANDYDVLILRNDLQYRIGAKTTANLLYQYQNRGFSNVAEDIYENLLLLTIRREL